MTDGGTDQSSEPEDPESEESETYEVVELYRLLRGPRHRLKREVGSFVGGSLRFAGFVVACEVVVIIGQIHGSDFATAWRAFGVVWLAVPVVTALLPLAFVIALAIAEIPFRFVVTALGKDFWRALKKVLTVGFYVGVVYVICWILFNEGKKAGVSETHNPKPTASAIQSAAKKQEQATQQLSESTEKLFQALNDSAQEIAATQAQLRSQVMAAEQRRHNALEISKQYATTKAFEDAVVEANKEYDEKVRGKEHATNDHLDQIDSKNLLTGVVLMIIGAFVPGWWSKLRGKIKAGRGGIPPTSGGVAGS